MFFYGGRRARWVNAIFSLSWLNKRQKKMGDNIRALMRPDKANDVLFVVVVKRFDNL